YSGFWLEVPTGMSIHSEYTASDEVEFCVLDSHNFELYNAGEPCNEIYYSIGSSQIHTFHAPKDDTYYLLLYNFGVNHMSASLVISRGVSWARFIYFGGIGLSAIGFIGMIVGFLIRPKMVEAPTRLLDVMKLHRRMKINELATRLKTTEADIELAVLRLQSNGERIQFDREKREVILETEGEEVG
ncbi:MAG: hypothetical protein NWE78_05730, partial [Candidatus Bathyarchaeota archaeon]|nr:hypothetical protein [Candidatus Bathyarchaeota archaeon]